MRIGDEKRMTRTPGIYAQMAAARSFEMCVRMAQRWRRWGSFLMNDETLAAGTARTNKGADGGTSWTTDEETPSLDHR